MLLTSYFIFTVPKINTTFYHPHLNEYEDKSPYKGIARKPPCYIRSICNTFICCWEDCRGIFQTILESLRLRNLRP